TLGSGKRAEQLTNTGRRRCGSQNRSRLAVTENSVKTVGVPGLVRIEERHRDGTGLDGGEERNDVVEPLWSKNRDTVATLGDLLQTGRNSAQTHTELLPGQLQGFTVTFA